MNELMPWAQTLGVVALGGAGVCVASLIGRRRWWPAACVAGVGLFRAARWVPWLELVAPLHVGVVLTREPIVPNISLTASY